MKRRFIREKNEFDQRVIADSQKLIVATYKHSWIKHENERKFRDIILTNVIYISEFMTNIVSRFVFQQKNRTLIQRIIDWIKIMLFTNMQNRNLIIISWKIILDNLSKVSISFFSIFFFLSLLQQILKKQA